MQAAMTINLTLPALTQAIDREAMAEREFKVARRARVQVLEDLAATWCPHAVGALVPVAKRRFMLVSGRSLVAGTTPDTWQWIIHGVQTVRVVGGAAVREASRQSMTASAYAALDDAIRAQVLDDLLQANAPDSIVGEGKPLRLGATQLSALGDLLCAPSGRGFAAHDRDAQGKLLGLQEGGRMALQCGTDYGSNPWEGLVRRGVLCLREGSLADPWQQWVVSAGPRLKDGYDRVCQATPNRYGLRPWPTAA